MACERTPADPRGVERHEVLVQVAATGTADTRPDEARFTAGVQTIDATAAAASRRNAEIINRVVAALRILEVRPEDVQSRQVSLGRIDYGRDRGRFQANNMIEVRVRNVDRIGQAIAATTDAGANVVSGPDLRVSDPNAANRTAYANAYRAARARAEAYAEAAGLRVARVLAIRDGGGGGGRPGHDYDMAAAEAAPPPMNRVSAPPVPPGMNTSQVSVRVDFALAE
ncbi:MAG TPA: SIMPL domain-containing protein [Allosphingosinicella sp.]